jgi:hypothetical protein
MKTKKKTKIIIHTIEVDEPERHRQFEIKLPANIKRIKGVILATTGKDLPG